MPISAGVNTLKRNASLSQISLLLEPLEAKVLISLAEGYGVNETAEKFGISRRTVLNYGKTIVATAVLIGLAE
jgi:DNA-binding CsgD family transcriptional regulator